MRATLRHVHRTGPSGLLAVVLGGLTVLVAGGTHLGLEALDRQVRLWRDELRIIVVLAEPPRTPEAADAVVAGIGALPGVAGVRYVSPEAALERLRLYLGVAGADLERLPANPVPARVEVRPAADAPAESIDRLIVEIGRRPGIAEVQAAVGWLAPVEHAARLGRRGGLTLGGVLGLAALLAQAAAARAAALAGAEETRILRLVGAPPVRVRLPALLAGALLGGLGVGGGLGGLALAGSVPVTWLAGWTGMAPSAPPPAVGLPPWVTLASLAVGLGAGLLTALAGPGLARRGARLALLAVSLASLTLDPSPILAAESLKVKRQALGEVRRQLEAAQARAAAARVREVSLLGEIEEIDQAIARNRRALARLDREIGQAQRELARLQAQQGEVAEQTVVQQAWLLDQLRVLDRLYGRPAAPGPGASLAGPDGMVGLELAGDLRAVIVQELGRLGSWERRAELLGSRHERADRTRIRLVELRHAVDAERAAIDAQAARRRALLQEVRGDRATQERLAGELSEAAAHLEALVLRLARQATRAARAPRPAVVASTRPPGPGGPAPFPVVGLGALRGQLPWPTAGRVLTGFGPQVHPRFGTQTVQHGIEIAAPEGAPVRAVHAGRVLHRGWLRGYGNLVLLDHGEGYYTLYAHLADALVSDGDHVEGGQVMARVGDTGTVDGPRLYFEVRYQGKADDPEAWLRRRP